VVSVRLGKFLQSPSARLAAGALVSLAVVGGFAGYTLYSVNRMRQVQVEIVERNRKDSLQLIRIQADLNALGLAMRDMLEGSVGWVRRPSQSRRILRSGEEARWLTPSKDTSRDHVPGQIPLPPRGGQVVVDHSSGAGGRVKDPIAAHIDRHMIDLGASTCEQEQVTKTPPLPSNCNARRLISL